MTTGPRSAKFPLRLDELVARRGSARSAVVPAASATSSTSAPSTVLTLAPKLHATAAAARAVLRPQRLLEAAHAHASRRVAPSGVGLDSTDIRHRMVDRLRRAGVRDERVLAAMATVLRHRFVDAALIAQAYEDTSLPIGHGQTISKPSVVARMLELLFGGAQAQRSGHLGRVLEVGTGCGYQAAVLASLARHVVSVERVQPLHAKARELLASSRPSHLRLVYGDGMLGHAPNAPYDSIVAAAGGDAVPAAWLEQLAIGGRLVCPVRRAGTDRQVLMVVDRTEHGHTENIFDAVHFVPLKSGLAAK